VKQIDADFEVIKTVSLTIQVLLDVTLCCVMIPDILKHRRVSIFRAKQSKKT